MSEAAIVDTPAEIPLPTLVDTLAPITAALNAATHEERLAWMYGLGLKQLRALYVLAKGSPVKIAEIADTAAVAIGEGKNGLPLFSRFQKRFAKHGDQIVGYNHNSAFVTFFVGPGHFVAYDSPEVPGEVWIDYRSLPAGRHPDFPELATNDRFPGPKLTYGGMVDKVRRVSRHMLIGDAFIGTEKSKGVPFALCLPADHG